MAAATTVFAERGVHGASVGEICETAGFTRGSCACCWPGALQRVVGLEFTLPVELAVEVLLATHASVQTRALFAADTDTTTLQEVVLAITRPLATPHPAAAQDA